MVDGYGEAIPLVAPGAPAGIAIGPLVVVVSGVEVTVSIVGLPAQMVTLEGVITGAVGRAFTFTVAVLLQPLSDAVTVYVVFSCGLAVTVGPDVPDRPVAGLQA
jgi:hypothetical protein